MFTEEKRHALHTRNSNFIENFKVIIHFKKKTTTM